MSRSSVSNRAEAMKACYEIANKTEKGCLLDEFTAITCHHRKSAIRVLSGGSREQLFEGLGAHQLQLATADPESLRLA